VLEQPGVGGQRRVQERVAGHEQHHELRRRVERLPIRLVGQLVDVRAQLPGVPGEVLFPCDRVFGLRSVQVCRERDLGVDHDLLAAREVHQQVGADTVLRHPGVEVAVPDHPGQFDHPLQLDLAVQAECCLVHSA
jgi:hypothetical protein